MLLPRLVCAATAAAAIALSGCRRSPSPATTTPRSCAPGIAPRGRIQMTRLPLTAGGSASILVVYTEDATTHAAIGGASIFVTVGADTVRRSAPSEFWRDTTGVTKFEGIAVGRYNLSVGRPGYARQQFAVTLDHGRDSAAVELTPLANALSWSECRASVRGHGTGGV